MDATTDSAIVHAVLAGKRDQFGQLVERHLPTVYAIACARVRNVADAEDVAQETFLSAFQRLDKLREPSKFEGSVATIARNAAIGFAKRRRREATAAANAPYGISVPAADMSRDELHRLVHGAVDQVHPQYREVLFLHYFAGKSTAEIARVLNISQSAVKKRLQRAREVLGGDLLNRLGGADQARKYFTSMGGAITVAALNSQVSTSLAATVASGPLVKGLAIAAGAVVLTVAIVAQQHRAKGNDATRESVASQIPATKTTVERVGIGLGILVEPAGVPEPAALAAATEITASPSAGFPSSFPSPSESLEKTLQTVVSVTFEDMAVEKILDFLSEVYGVSFKLDARVIAPLERDEPRLWFAMDESNRLPEGIVPLSDYVTDGMFDDVDIRDAPITEALSELLGPLGLDYVLEPGFVWISTPGRIESEVVRLPPSRFKPYRHSEILEKTVSLTFTNIHLLDILDFMSEAYDMDFMSRFEKLVFVIDFRVVQMPPVPRPKDDTPSERPPAHALRIPGTAVTDGYVPHVNLQNVQLRDALRCLLRPLNLSYAAIGNDIIISTPANIAANDLPLESLKP